MQYEGLVKTKVNECLGENNFRLLQQVIYGVVVQAN